MATSSRRADSWHWVDLGLFLVARILGPVIRAETARFVLADPAAGEARTEYARLPTRATVALGDKLLGQYGLPPAGGDVIASKDAAIRCRRATHCGNRNSPASVCHQKAEKRRFLDNIHQWEGSIVKITTLIIVLLGLATASGAAMIVSVKKEPVLLACGVANC